MVNQKKSDDERPPPQNIVHFPLSGDLSGGNLILFGNPKSSKVIFLQAGFPDDHQSFLPLATKLTKSNDCLVGVSCMPGYDIPTPLKGPKPGGYSFEDAIASVRDGIQALIAQCKVDAPELTVIFHDWGVFFGTMYVNRMIIEGAKSLIPKQLVLLDVLPPPHPEDKEKLTELPRPTLRQLVTETVYRIFFAICFALQRFISSLLAQAFFAVGSVVLFSKTVNLNPTGDLDGKRIQGQSRQPPLALSRLIWMMYPYYNLFFDGPLSYWLEIFRLPKLSGQDSIPVLYMYGTEKVSRQMCMEGSRFRQPDC
jgi:hypothetical protein